MGRTNERTEFLYFQKKGGDGTADGEVKIGDFDLEDFASNPDILEILSKESIASGHSADVIRQLNEAQEAIQELTERKEPIADELALVLADEIGDVQSLEIQTETKEFVDKLIRTLEAQASLTNIGGRGGGERKGGGGPDEWAPARGANAVVGEISRSELTGPDDSVVAVFPSKESGLRFLKENNAWAFVRIGQVPDYTAMYVTRTAREVQYVAEVQDVVKPHEADLARPVEEYTTGDDELDPNKRVVRFKPGTLYELEDPIPFGEKYPQGLRYTDLGRLKSATVTDDLF